MSDCDCLPGSTPGECPGPAGEHGSDPCACPCHAGPGGRAPRPPGRPPLPGGQGRQVVQLGGERKEAVAEAAEAEEVSVSEWIRRAVDARIEYPAGAGREG